MYNAIDRVASRQHALITTAQLHAAGLSNRQIYRFHKKGVFSRMRTHVYRMAGGPITWIQTVHGAILAAGPGAVISHGTAAALWCLLPADRNRCGMHLTAHHQVRLLGVTAHTTALGPGDTTVHQGIPVTTPERTLMDLASSLSPTQLGECLDDALRRGLVRLERLRRLVIAAAARRGRRLLAPLHRLLSERLPGYRPGGSDWERAMDDLWDRLGLPAGERQYRVQVNGRTYFIDRAIPELKIGAEFNGHEHHHLRSDRDHDAERGAQLSAAGWHIMAFTDATRPETLRDAVQRIAADRRRWLAHEQAAPNQFLTDPVDGVTTGHVQRGWDLP